MSISKWRKPHISIKYSGAKKGILDIILFSNFPYSSSDFGSDRGLNSFVV